MAHFYVWQVQGRRGSILHKLAIAGFGDGNILALINDYRTFEQDGREATPSNARPNVKTGTPSFASLVFTLSSGDS